MLNRSAETKERKRDDLGEGKKALTACVQGLVSYFTSREIKMSRELNPNEKGLGSWERLTTHGSRRTRTGRQREKYKRRLILFRHVSSNQIQKTWGRRWGYRDRQDWYRLTTQEG